MKALLLDSEHGMQLVSDYLKPVPAPSEALIRVTRAGICNTDLEILKGYAGFHGVMGHEFLGVVEQVEPNAHNIAVGDRVVGEINLACNSCAYCRQGGFLQRNHCLERTVLGIVKKDGCMAEYLTLPIANLLPVPSSVPDEVAVFAEPLAAAYRIIEQNLIPDGARVAVIGDGKLGLLITEVLLHQPTAQLNLFGRHMEKMQLIQGEVERVVVNEETGTKFENAFDVCVEASGKPSGLMMSANITRPLGTVVLKTTCAAESEGFNTAPFVVKELNVVGSRCGNFRMALNAMEKGLIDPRKYISQVYPFHQALEAMEHAGRRGTMKIQLQF